MADRAKNFDSVFADCTKDELEFDAIFDDADDMIIDIIAGVNEAGIPLTGEDFDFSVFENNDMVGEKPDFDYQKDGDASYSLKDAEGTKGFDLDIGGEVGDCRAVSGKEKSAESSAYDVTDDIDNAIGANDKKQTSFGAPRGNGPLDDDDEAERAGVKEEVDYLLAMLEADDEDLPDESDNEVDTGAEAEDECGKSCHEAHDLGEEKLCPDCGKNPCECKSTNESACDEGPLEDDDEAERAGVKEEVDYLLAMLEADDEDLPDESDNEVETESYYYESADDEDLPDESDNEVETESYYYESADDEGPLEDDDEAERSGVEESVDYLLAMLESDDPIDDYDDFCMRNGCAKRSTTDVEGDSQRIIGASFLGSNTKDPIEDECDTAERLGLIKHSTSDEEGVKSHVIGSAYEEAADSLLAALDDDDDIEAIDKGWIIPDSVQQSGYEDSQIKTNEAADDIIEDIDDEDIQEVEDNSSDSSSIGNLEYDDDDDELINAIINGLDVD